MCRVLRAIGINGISWSQVSKLARGLNQMVEEFRNRPLDSEHYTYLSVDPLYRRVREGGRVGAMLTDDRSLPYTT